MDLSADLLIGRYAEPGVLRARIGENRGADGGVAGTRNASFAAYSRRHALLYAVREDDEGAIDVLAAESGFERVAEAPSGGKLPCHCALDGTESFLAVANYGSGEVAAFALDPGTGAPLPGPWRYRGAGQGPDKERQSGPHAHWVGFTPDQRWLLSTDLGADRIRAFAFDPARGVVSGAREAYVAPPGSGPRWLAWLGKGERALLVSELASTVSLLAWRDRARSNCSIAARRARRPRTAISAGTSLSMPRARSPTRPIAGTMRSPFSPSTATACVSSIRWSPAARRRASCAGSTAGADCWRRMRKPGR